MHIITVKRDEKWKDLHIFGNVISVKKHLRTEWNTHGNLKVLKIPEKDISIYIYSDQTIHVVVNDKEEHKGKPVFWGSTTIPRG